MSRLSEHQFQEEILDFLLHRHDYTRMADSSSVERVIQRTQQTRKGPGPLL